MNAETGEPARQWQAALGDLQLQMTRATFDTWLRGSHLVGVDGHTWTVGVRHAYAVDWLEARLLPLIERAASRRAGREIRVRFEVRANREAPDRKPDEDEGTDDDQDLGREVLVEAVREERVQLHGDGSALLWTDFYIKLKVAFRKKALRKLKGARLSVFLCLALHQDKYGIAEPGVNQIMEETGYASRSTVCSALDDLVDLRFVEKLDANRWGNDRYRVLGYAWFGKTPAPALFELGE